MTLKEAENAIVEEFSMYEEWLDKYEYLIELGKSLKDYPESAKTDEKLIKGCQSRVWLDYKLEDGKIVFNADSDAIITKGIISLLIGLYSGRTPQEILSSDFCVVERFLSPHIIKIHDGGGMFPVTRHVSEHPNRTFLSPDGKWLLLDYFNSIILMRHENKEIHFCLYSHTGKVAQHMGFLDCNHFWYTWGDTTYIQKIEA